jgi:hypothetical protein
MLKSHLPAFARAAQLVAHEPWFSDDWFCVQGLWPNQSAPEAVVLKIAKRSWTHDSPASMNATNRSESGVHFAAWIDANDTRTPLLHYGMHVFELPHDSGPRLKSSDFTNAFRAHFRAQFADWPGCAWGRGPRTPFAGEIPLVTATLTDDMLALMRRFAGTAAFVDAQLNQMRLRNHS